MTINEHTMEAVIQFEDWTEPEQIGGITIINFDPANYKIEGSLQNRMESGKKKLVTTKEGFVVNQSKIDAIADYYLLQARRGESSHMVVDPLTIAILNDEEYFIGGHGRAAGLMLARERVEQKDKDHLKSLFELGKDVEVSDSDMDLMENLKKLRVRKFACANRRDLEWLAAMENSDAQNGERLSSTEKREIIDKHLGDEAFAQFKDLAFAIRVLGDAGCRSTVRTRRKALYADSKTPYKAGLLDVNGKPNNAAGAGKKSIDKVNKVGKRLRDNFVSLGKVPLESRDETTYVEFEKMRKLWHNAVEDASRWLQKPLEDGRSHKDHLFDALAKLEGEIGYTEYHASLIGVEGEGVVNSQPNDDTDEGAINESAALAERMKAEALSGIPQNTPPPESTPEPSDPHENTPPPESAPEPSDPHIEKMRKLGEAALAVQHFMDHVQELREALEAASVVGHGEFIDNIDTDVEDIEKLVNAELEAGHAEDAPVAEDKAA